MKKIRRSLQTVERPPIPEGFRERLVEAVPDTIGDPNRSRRRYRFRYVAAAVVILAAGLMWLRDDKDSGVPVPAPPFEIAFASAAMADVTTAMMDPQAIYLEVDIRTRPNEPFDYVQPEADFIRVHIWLERPSDRFPNGRMRLDKPGHRQVIFNGESTLITLTMMDRQEAKHFSGGRIDRMLADPSAWLSALSPSNQAHVTIDTVTAVDGVWEAQMTVTETGQELAGGSTRAFYPEFDRKAIVAWETDTRRLRNIERYVLVEGKEVQVSGLRTIRYSDGFDDSVFSHDLPDGVHVMAVKDPDDAELSRLGPEEVAHRFFEAWKREDWDTVSQFCESSLVIWYMRLEGIETYRITGPKFKRNPQYPGWHIPYELGLKSGGMKRHAIALRNDNKMNRYVFDGGI